MVRFQGASRAATVALSMLFVATASYSAGGAGDTPKVTTDPCSEVGDHTIVVGSDKVDCKEVHVSKSAGNQVTWRSASGEKIEVVFKPKAGVVPFPSLNCPGSAPVCNSGAIDAAASGKFDYDVWLYTGGTKKPIDPVVIIDP